MPRAPQGTWSRLAPTGFRTPQRQAAVAVWRQRLTLGCARRCVSVVACHRHQMLRKQQKKKEATIKQLVPSKNAINEQYEQAQNVAMKLEQAHDEVKGKVRVWRACGARDLQLGGGWAVG